MTTLARLPTGLRAIAALILREMSTSYGRSPGGWIWAVLQPVGAIAMMSLAFSMALRHPSLGFSFPLFYASGLLPYMLFNDLSNKLGQALRYSRALMSYPVVTTIDALAARLLFNALIHAVIFLLVISGCLLVFDARSAPEPLVLARGFGLAVALGAGIGTLNCYLGTTFPAWDQVWAIVTRPLILISGVFFILEDVPHPYDSWLAWNPLIHVTGTMRAGLYPGYQPEAASPGFVLAIAFVTGFVGLALIRRDRERLLV